MNRKNVIDYIAINLTQLYKIHPEKSYIICTKNEIYLFTHGGNLMKKFQVKQETKKSLAALAISVKIALFSTPIKSHPAGIIAKLHGIGFAGGIAQAGADGGE